MISEAYGQQLAHAIRTSGRLRDTDHAVIARALLLIIDHPESFPADPTEALVRAIAKLVVSETAEGAA